MAAVAFFEGGLRVAPAAVDGWFLLGAARHRLRDLAAARAAFEEAARLDPAHLQSRFALAAVCIELADAGAAQTAAREALALAPEDPSAWFGLGVAREVGGQSDAALTAYAEALVRNPVHVGALRNRARLLSECGRAEAALADLRRLVEALPEDANAWGMLADTQLALEQYPAAAEACARALRCLPSTDNGPLLLRCGFALAQCERFTEAQDLLDQVAQSRPALIADCRRSIFGPGSRHGQGQLDARVLFLLRHYDALERCDWRCRGYFIQRFSELLVAVGDEAPLGEPALGFRALALGLDPALQTRLAGQIADAVGCAATVPATVPGMPLRLGGSRRMRVGYLSGDFRGHACAWLMGRLPELHDRDRFTVHLYSTGPDDGSEPRRRLAAAADSFVDAARLDDAALAQRIADDGIDILVDLAGYTDYSRPGVLAYRPAPLQVAYLGYLQTSGAEWVDYAIADRHILPPDLRRHWRECIVFLPATLFICDDAPFSSAAPDCRADWGLPGDAFVFCCLNASWKIDPGTFECWMEILAHVPGAYLWLYATSEAVRDNLRRAACAAGIDGERLVFAGRVAHSRHLARFAHADVFLDTFVCNGHTTIIEALAAGLPVVSLPGGTSAGRVGASLLAAHGLGELIAGSRDDYVRTACRLAAEPAYLRAMRARATDRRNSLLFDTERRVREIERAFDMMWARHEAGLPPADFAVPETVV